ncbi:hypothetical protein [Streptomyces sp. NPDC048659]|uniref:hypothetical protein n=1 Tax=Streptomyces sp. NPDC048659 TaxID=3155489 RepID=UPI00343B92FC
MALNADPRPSGEGGEEDEVLPCGRSLEEVWEGAAGHGRGTAADDGHGARCPHCSAAVAELRSLDRLIAAARDLDTRSDLDARSGPGARIGPCAPGAEGADGFYDAHGAAEALTARVMDVVRLELRPGRRLPLDDGADGSGWIFESAAARELRAAVDALPGIRAGSCRIHPLGETGSEDGAGRGPLRVRVAVAASLAALPGAAETVRDTVFAVADEALGMDVREVDVRVVDVLAEDVPPGPEGGPGPERSSM